jgi:hypothetical protein
MFTHVNPSIVGFFCYAGDRNLSLTTIKNRGMIEASNALQQLENLRQSKRMARPWRGREELYENNNCKDGGHEVDDDKEVQYSIRRSRRATSYHYQDSSSLAPAQIIEQEVYYQTAKDVIMECVLLAHLIVLALAVYNHFHAMVDRWQRFGDALADAVVQACFMSESLSLNIE